MEIIQHFFVQKAKNTLIKEEKLIRTDINQIGLKEEQTVGTQINYYGNEKRHLP